MTQKLFKNCKFLAKNFILRRKVIAGKQWGNGAEAREPVNNAVRCRRSLRAQRGLRDRGRICPLAGGVAGERVAAGGKVIGGISFCRVRQQMHMDIELKIIIFWAPNISKKLYLRINFLCKNYTIHLK